MGDVYSYSNRLERCIVMSKNMYKVEVVKNKGFDYYVRLWRGSRILMHSESYFTKFNAQRAAIN